MTGDFILFHFTWFKHLHWAPRTWERQPVRDSRLWYKHEFMRTKSHVIELFDLFKIMITCWSGRRRPSLPSAGLCDVTWQWLRSEMAMQCVLLIWSPKLTKYCKTICLCNVALGKLHCKSKRDETDPYCGWLSWSSLVSSTREQNGCESTDIAI